MTRPDPWSTPFALRTYVSGVLLLIGTAISWATLAPDVSGWLSIRLDLAGVFYLAAAAVGSANFSGAALRAARRLRLDMNFLMFAAVIGALLIGESFEAAALASLFSTAELLERYAVDRGRRSIARLVELFPHTAERLEADGSITQVSLDALKAGDRVVVRPGGRVPADGRVVAGASAVDESTVTGESVPKDKGVGDDVFAATINTHGTFDMEVTADVQHSTLSRVIELVRAAESRRAPIEQFVQRFAKVYTPTVVILAVAVMAVPPLLLGAEPLEFVRRGLTLLVVACPCALVIATPVTVVSALTSAARHGVLIKGGEHLEALGAMRALAIDKTGTLTRGKLDVVGVETAGTEDAAAFLRLVGALEARSEHPLAKAIAAYVAGQHGVGETPCDEFTTVTGRGARGRVAGTEVLVGTSDFVGVDPSTFGAAPEGATLVFARADNGRCARFALRDEPRPEAAAVVRLLRRLGIRHVAVLSGDAESAVKHVAASVQADTIHARQLPGDKVAVIQRLRSEGTTVGMLGDGVNDAPALATASVGIAMGAAGSPAAIETADVALMADDLTMLPFGIALARAARKTIRLNIAFALGLKLLLAVGAIAGVVSLAVAVLLGDMGGSLFVTINALRLARHVPRAASLSDR